MYEMKEKYRRYVVLFVGCCLLMTAAEMGSVANLSDGFKKRLSLSQKQTELLISMCNFGFCIGLPSALVLEHVGPRWASLSAMVVAFLGYSGWYMALVYPETFGGSLYWLTVVSVFVAGDTITNEYLPALLTGLGSVHMYINGVAVNAYNFPIHHRGKIIGLVSCSFFVGIAFWSTLYNLAFGPENILLFIFIGPCSVILISLVAMLLLKKIPPECADEAGVTVPEGDVDDTKKTNTKPEEKDRLLRSKKPNKVVYYGEYSLFEALKSLDFHCIMWSITLAATVSFTYSFSLPIYLESFDMENLKVPLMAVGPICAALSKFGVGLGSDLTLTRFPRLVYLIVLLSLETILMLLNCFIGDQTIVVVLNTIVQFSTLAAFTGLVSTLMADFYGITHFASKWGTISCLFGLGSLAMPYLMGALYDLEIEGEGDTCYGLKCFRVIFIISFVLCITSMILLVSLYRKHIRILDEEHKLQDLSVKYVPSSK